MRYCILLAFLAGVSAAEWVDLGFDGLPSAEITVLESTCHGMVVELVTPGLEVTRTIQGGSVYHQLSIPGSVPNAADAGHPSIPSVSFLCAVPETGVSSITIENAVWLDLGAYTPAPMQPIPSDGSYEPVPFTVEQSTYSGSIPVEQVAWISDGILRGVHVGRFNIAPVRWNAETGVLSVSPYHIQIQHSHTLLQRKKWVITIMKRSEKSLFFTGKEDEEHASFGFAFHCRKSIRN